MLVMLVMLLLLLLLLLPGTGWLPLAMADPPIGRTAVNHMLASVVASQLLRWWKKFLGCAISSATTRSMKTSLKMHWSLWGYAIAWSIPFERNLQHIMRGIMSIFLAWTSGHKEWKSTLRQRNTSVYALLLPWLMLLGLYLLCAPPPGQHSCMTVNSPDFQADRQWWMAIGRRVIDVRTIL